MADPAVRAHPQPVRLKHKRLEAYRRLAGDDVVTAIRELGSAGRQRVRDEFLISRLLHEQLALLKDLLA